MSSRKARRFTALAAVVVIPAAALSVGAAGFASAATNAAPPLNATVTITTSITESLSTPSIDFGTLAPGTGWTQTAGGSPSEVFTVTSNDQAGYSIQWVPPTNDNFVATTGSFPVTGNLAFGAPGGYNAGSDIPAGASMPWVNTHAPSAPTGDVYAEDFYLQVPAGQAGGAYTATGFSALAVGN